MSTLLTLLVAFIGSSAATAIVNAIIGRIREKRKSEDGERHAMKYLLKRDLETRGKELLEGGVSYSELKDWEAEHRIYHEELGGNGDLDPLHQALQNEYLRNPKGD